MQNNLGESSELEPTPNGAKPEVEEVEVVETPVAVTTPEAKKEVVEKTNEQLELAPLERAILNATVHPAGGEKNLTLEELTNNPEIISIAEEVLANTGRENVSPSEVIENTLQSLVQRELVTKEDGSNIIAITEQGTNILTNQEEE